MGVVCCKRTDSQCQEITTEKQVQEHVRESQINIILQKQSLTKQVSSNVRVQSNLSYNVKKDGEEQNIDLIIEVQVKIRKEEYVEGQSNKIFSNDFLTVQNLGQEQLIQQQPKIEESKPEQIVVVDDEAQDSDDSEDIADLQVVKSTQPRQSLVIEIPHKDNFSRSQKGPNSMGTITSSVSKQIKIGVELFVHLRKGSISSFYTTGQVLGQGAFGKVWKVTHKTTGLVRAMKQLKKSALIKEEEQRLFAEMNILKGLDHPNIVKLYELYQDQQNYYLVTEYLSGGELFDRIKKMQHFSENKAADYIRQILMAVNYCHEQKIVHRDLKPENIIFINETPESKLKIIDFGTSRKFDPTKQMTKQLGTPYYIAPEVLTHKYCEKCDIWSCGVILFILLCGYPPFTGRSENEIIEKVRKGQFKFDPHDWDSISLDAKTLIKKMLTLDQNKRISAKDCLLDPWLVKHAPTSQINKKALLNLSSFQAKSIFKQALLSYIASQMTTQNEIEDLQKTFESLDKNSDGLLSKQELIEGYMLVLKDRTQAEQQVDHILAQVDINLTGLVDFSEFLMAAMNQEKLLSVKKIEQAFQIFDQNGDGYLSKQELEQVMGDLDINIWNQILSECDNKGDGRISQDEFTRLLQNQC